MWAESDGLTGGSAKFNEQLHNLYGIPRQILLV
jgi:hypothetical protein